MGPDMKDRLISRVRIETPIKIILYYDHITIFKFHSLVHNGSTLYLSVLKSLKLEDSTPFEISEAREVILENFTF